MTLRTSSESSEFSDLEVAGVEPLTLDDISFQPSYAALDLRYVELNPSLISSQFLCCLFSGIRIGQITQQG